MPSAGPDGVVLGIVLGIVLGDALGDADGEVLGDPVGDPVGDGDAVLDGDPVGDDVSVAVTDAPVGDAPGAPCAPVVLQPASAPAVTPSASSSPTGPRA